MQIADKSHDTKGMVALAGICAVLQLALSPNFAIGNGHPNFALVFCACIALSRGGAQGVVAGFVAGLFFDLSSTGPIGLMALLLTIAAYVLGSEQRNRMAGDFAASVAIFSVWKTIWSAPLRISTSPSRSRTRSPCCLSVAPTRSSTP